MTAPSPLKRTRTIPNAISMVLCGRAAGRCEFAGCNRDLTTHHLTLSDGNFAERAHICAFSTGGPRFNTVKADDPHAVDNLMLLCGSCHKLVDDRPEEFPVDVLRRYKATHEARVLHVTGLDDSWRTVVVQLKAKIGGEAVDIPLAEVTRAVAPYYPIDRRGHVIDVSGFDDRAEGFLSLAAQQITREVQRLYAPGMATERIRHLSVFALAPMPLLVHFGACLSNKVTTIFHQRHRDTNDWAWKSDGPNVGYIGKEIKSGSDPSKVALILSLSGVVDQSAVPPMNDPAFSVWEITLEGRGPGVDFLRRREDLDAFASTYRDCLASISAAHPGARELHLFPAVPAPVAIRCGYDVLKKAQPNLVVWDFDRSAGGFKAKLEVTYDVR